MSKESHTLSGSTYGMQELDEAGSEAILEAGLADYTATSGKPGRGYFTFLDDGYSHDIVALLISEAYPDFILVSAHEKDMLAAIGRIIKLNGHLLFKPLSVVDSEGESAETPRTHKLFFEEKANLESGQLFIPEIN